MKAVKVTLDPAALSVLRERIQALRERLPPGAVISEGSYLRELLRQDLRRHQQERRTQAGAILAKYWHVPAAVGATWFRRLQGRVPLDELQSAAYEEASKAAHRFDAELGFSPAPFLRMWADWGVRALLRQRQADDALVRPDGDADDAHGSRWERLGERDDSLEAAPERAELRAAAQAWLTQQGPTERRALKLLAQGDGDDQVAAATGLSLAELALLREGLAQATGAAQDAELTPQEAAQAAGVATKVVHKALLSGALLGRKRQGRWVLRAAEVRAWARMRAKAA